MSLLPELMYPFVTCNKTPADILLEEFYNLQDLDGNGMIYGYQFFIEGYDKPQSLVELASNEFWKNPKLSVKSWNEYTTNGLTNISQYDGHPGDRHSDRTPDDLTTFNLSNNSIKDYKNYAKLSVMLMGDTIILEYDKASVWKQCDCWGFVRKFNKWFGFIFDKLTDSNIEADISKFNGSQSNILLIQNFKPEKDYIYGFCVSNNGLRERSNVRSIVWRF